MTVVLLFLLIDHLKVVNTYIIVLLSINCCDVVRTLCLTSQPVINMFFFVCILNIVRKLSHHITCVYGYLMVHVHNIGGKDALGCVYECYP